MMARTQWQKQFHARYGPWAVVTGASSGIGRALAFRLAESGMNLVLTSRRVAELTELSDELRKTFEIECHVYPIDLAEESAVECLMAETKNIDVGLFVASAGFGTSGSFLDNPLTNELDMLHLNCRALMTLTWHCGRRLLERGRGGVILLSSIVGFQGMPHAAHYAATKAYVQTLGEALAIELAPLGIDVLAAAPGPTRTGFAERAGMTMGQALDPLEIAQPILNALGRRSTILPGFLSKLLVYSLAPLPRWARVRIMGKVMQGMTITRKGHV